jgi:hypothetical protein
VGHAIRDALAPKAAEAKNHGVDKRRYAKCTNVSARNSRTGSAGMNHEVEGGRFAQMPTIDEIMTLCPSDLEKVENITRLERSRSTNGSPAPPTAKESEKECLELVVETSLNTSTFYATKTQCGYSIAHRPMPVTRQGSDQFSPIKLEDIHNLDMSLFHAYLAQAAQTFPCFDDNEQTREDINCQIPSDSEESNADAEFASFIIDALSDDDDSQSAVTSV